MENESSNRRRFIRKLAKLGAAGGITALLSTEKTLIPPAQAGGPLYIDATNFGYYETYLSSSCSGRALWVDARASSGNTTGVRGRSYSTDGTGVEGWAPASSGSTRGVFGRSDSTSGRGVYGFASQPSGGTAGVYGQSDSISGTGVWGLASKGTGLNMGVIGQSNSTSGRGVYGLANATSGSTIGVLGLSNSPSGCGVLGVDSTGTGVFGSSSAGIGVRARSGTGNALYVEGKNYFKSAQRGTIPLGVSQYDVTVPAGIAIRTGAMIFVTLMSDPVSISVKWVERLSDTQFRIYLTGTTTGNVNFGYFVVN